MKARNRDMCSGPMLGNIILYTIPVILTSVMQLLFNTADLVIVGRFCGSVSVGAVGATSSATTLIFSLFLGLSVGAGATAAQSIGAGDFDKTSRTVHTTIPTAFLGGIGLAIIGNVVCKPLLTLMGTPENVLPLSTVYMRIYFAAMPFNMLYNFGAALLRSAGDTKRPLIYVSISGVVNVVLNVIFVTVFHMDVAGVALATTISISISSILILRALMRRHDALHFNFKEMCFDKAVLKKMLSIGVPSGLQSSLFSISNLLIQSSVNSFGDVFLAGNSAAGNIEGYIYMVMAAFYHAALNFSAQNYGAKKFDRIKKSLVICALCTGICGFILGGLTYIFGDTLLSIYITDNPQAITYGLMRISIICTPYFLCGIMDTITGAIRGMGSSFTTMIITVFGTCVLRITWIYTIFAVPQWHTPQCLFLSYPISWSVTIIAELVAFAIVLKKKKQQALLTAEE